MIAALLMATLTWCAGLSHLVLFGFGLFERECFGAIAQMCVCTDSLPTAFDSLAQDRCEKSDIHENT